MKPMTSEELHAYEEALDDVENPGTWPVGAPGSAKRRAYELGRTLADARAKLAECERKRNAALSVAATFRPKLASAESALAAERARGERLRELLEESINIVDMFNAHVQDPISGEVLDPISNAIATQYIARARAALAIPDAAEEKT